MKGLIIRSPWIDLVLQGEKTWEIRGANTCIRGRIALIKSGTGCVFGTVELVDCLPLDLMNYQGHIAEHRVTAVQSLPYPKTFAWVLARSVPFEQPVPYRHPKGAVIWVNEALDDGVQQIGGVFVCGADARPVH